MPKSENRNGAGDTRFKPGQSGNPGGRPKGLAAKVREMVPADQLAEWYYALWTRDETKLKELGVDLKDVTLDQRNKAGEWLGERGYGKAPAYAPVNDGDPLDLDQTDRAIASTLDDLAARREAKAPVGSPGTAVAGDSSADAASASG